ncbi:hypothetical protein BKK44_08420 [Bacillus cereus]|nr:hypothetical protein BKK44_08420 [Bacillus cereus]
MKVQSIINNITTKPINWPKEILFSITLSILLYYIAKYTCYPEVSTSLIQSPILFFLILNTLLYPMYKYFLLKFLKKIKYTLENKRIY